MILFSFMYLNPVRANPDVTAFVDGGSVAIGTSETTLATLPTSFPAGNNFVIAIVQLDSSATATITTGALYLRRVGSIALMSNYYTIYLSSATFGRGRWYALMGIDTGAGASPTYEVKVAGASATGVSGEAKILAISGVTGAQQESSEVDIGTSETTLVTLATSLPAGDNVVLAISQTINTGNKQSLSYMRLKRSATLAESQYPLYHGVPDDAEYMQVQLIPYLDSGAPASPTYTVTTAEGESGSKIKGVAKIVAFSKGIFSAAYVDGASAFIGTSETTTCTLISGWGSGIAGNEVAVIASEQFATGDFYSRSVSAGANKLQYEDLPELGQTVNEYLMNFREGGSTPIGDHGKGFGLLGRWTNVPGYASQYWKTKATASDTGLFGESKILALCAPILLTFKEKYVVTSTTAVTTTSTSLQDDTQAIQDFSLTASQTVLAIYQANNVHGAFMPQAYGMQNAIRVDGTDYANSWDTGALSAYAVRNMVFWIGTLGSGSHTIKGRFASGLSGSTATVSNRILLIYVLNGNAYRYVDSSTNSTTSGTSFADDPAAQFTFTPPSSCKALILYNIANYYSYDQNEDKNGKKAAINVGGTDYAQAEKSSYGLRYSDSVFTAWALSLSATSSTVKGRFACSIASSVYINRRQLGVLMFADDTLLNTVNSDTQVSTSSTDLVDDSQATISRTTTETRELLVVAMGTKRFNTADSDYGMCYGIMVDGNDRANSRGSPCTGSVYANSAATAYAENLAAGSHTIKGRFATNAGSGTTKVDSRRIVALWLTCPPPVPEFPFGTSILAIPMVAVYLYLRRGLRRRTHCHSRASED